MNNTKTTYEPYVKVYVDCSYEQKEYAKSKGFKFNYNKKMWYLKIKFDNYNRNILYKCKYLYIY